MATDGKEIAEKIDSVTSAWAAAKAWLTKPDKPKGVDTPEQAVEYIMALFSAFRPLQNNANSINNPFFYKVERDGKVFYILGLNYYLRFSNLPARVKDYAKTTKILIQDVYQINMFSWIKEEKFAYIQMFINWVKS